MRAAFGLVSLLVVTCIVLLVFARTQPKVLETGQKATEQAQTIAGRDADGRSALESIKLEPKFNGNQFKSLQVANVTAGGAMDQHYGLRVGDQIVQIGDVGTDTFADGGMAESMVLDAFQRSRPLVVLRDGKQVTLPTAPDGAPALPANPLQSQLDAIKSHGQ